MPDSNHQALLAEVLRSLVRLLPVHPAAHAYVHGHSVETALLPHVGCKYLQMLDLQDAFRHVRTHHVERGLLLCGAGPAEATVVLDLCMCNDRLPVGAVTSNHLFNVALWLLDFDLEKHDGVYTRYSDQLIRSSLCPIDEGEDREHITDFGFPINERKSWLRVRGKHRLEIMGWVIGERELHRSREYRRRCRAQLHQEGDRNAGPFDRS